MMKWTNIYKDEIGLFLGSTGLIFLIRCAGLIFNNFTETAFLKRFDVAFLPILYIINPMITVLLLGKLSSLKLHISAYGRLFFLLIICSVSSIPIVGMLFLKIPLLYPLLFIMKVQFETLLSVFFWNLGNELFDFHQSKRLFPLMTAGGVLGDMGGNILTLLLSNAVSINHLMLVYGGVLLSAACLTRYLEEHFSLQDGSGKQAPPSEKKQSIISNFAEIRPLLKWPSLILVITVLTFFANAVLPIMNYQFNVAIDHNFAQEQQMLFFLGSFRGAMNIVSMILLLLSGKFYDKWSIPVALMFHPLNYLLIFTAFLFRFDLMSAMYARFSTNVIRTTFNQPVNNMLIGIFPDEYRSKIRPFLRGIVARGGLITGSCMILLFRNLLTPQALSLLAFPFVLCWITTVGFLKWKYPIFIIKMLSPDTLDLNPTKDHVLQRMFRKKIIQKKLVENLHTARGENAVLYARLLRYLEMNRLEDQLIYDDITSFQQLNSRDTMDYCNGLFLLVFFNRISKRSMKGIFFTIKDLNLFAFFEQELRYAEICLSIMETLKKSPGTLSNRLLQRHLAEIRTSHIRTALQLAAIKDNSGSIWIILKSLFSRNLRKRANALEAIENVIHPKLLRGLMPFLKGISPEEMLNSGQNHLKVPASVPVSVNAALGYLLKSNNQVTVRLTRGVLQEFIEHGIHTEFIKKTGSTEKGNPQFVNNAGEHKENPWQHQDSMEIVMKKKLNFQEKIIYVQEVDIFKHLTISELAAISDLADEITIAPGEILFHEKTFAGTMYICVEGELVGSRNNVEAGRFRSGDSFGKNAFLVDSTHFLTCRAKTRTRLLEIHRQEFEEMLMVYPQLSCEIAKTHAGIIQWLLDQIKEGKNHECLMEIFFNKGYC